MFKIDRNNPWPPAIDLTSARNALKAMERDMPRVPQLADAVRALRDVLHAFDQAEAKAPKRLSDHVITHSRFRPGPRDGRD